MLDGVSVLVLQSDNGVDPHALRPPRGVDLGTGVVMGPPLSCGQRSFSAAAGAGRGGRCFVGRGGGAASCCGVVALVGTAQFLAEHFTPHLQLAVVVVVVEGAGRGWTCVTKRRGQRSNISLY